ncbi:MAG: hypothetical protein AMXMBFR53_42740 [Gemmatimonadota bacterium]
MSQVPEIAAGEAGRWRLVVGGRRGRAALWAPTAGPGKREFEDHAATCDSGRKGAGQDIGHSMQAMPDLLWLPDEHEPVNPGVGGHLDLGAGGGCRAHWPGPGSEVEALVRESR